MMYSHVQYHKPETFDPPTPITIKRLAENPNNWATNFKFLLLTMPLFVRKACNFTNCLVIFVKKEKIGDVFVGRGYGDTGYKMVS